MDTAAVARPYAAAAFAVAYERDAIDAWFEALGRLAKVMQALMAVMHGGKLLSSDEQTDILLEAAECDDEQKRFVAVLAENSRLSALPAISAKFEALRLAHANILRVRVESAIAIDNKKVRQAFDAFLTARFGKTVETTYEENPALIGGVRVYANDNVLDASIRGRLDKLAETLI